MSDLLTLAQWANTSGRSLRATFRPGHSDVCVHGTWDLTIKPARDGSDHEHFGSDDLHDCIAYLANEYDLPDAWFSSDVKEARASDRVLPW